MTAMERACAEGEADEEPKYLGNFAACEPWAAQLMTCDDCNVCWTGCWDNFECPQCRNGNLPSMELEVGVEVVTLREANTVSNDDLRNAIVYVERIYIDYPGQKPALDIVMNAARDAESKLTAAEARIAALMEELRVFRDYAESVWFDEATATNEERELMRRSKALVTKQKSPESAKTQGQ